MPSKYLSILYRAWVFNWGHGRFARGCEYGSDILLKIIKGIVFIISLQTP